MESPNRQATLSFSGGFLLFFTLGLVLFQWISAGNPSEQPIAYNHAVHIESGLECTECHAGAQEQARATLPSLDTCLMCHSEPITESPEEEKIVALAAAGQEAPWIQLTRVPTHVYFSHRRHVALGELECSQCHGPMETLTQPPERPFRALDMDDCMECHEQRSIRNDCNDCHR